MTAGPLRLALVTRRYWPLVGGAEMAMANLAVEFRRLGHAATVITAQWEPHWPLECVHREVPVVRLPQPQIRGWGTIRYMHALSRYLRRHRDDYDAVLVSMLKHDAYAAVKTLAGSRVPVVIRAEGAGATGDIVWHTTARFGGRMRAATRSASAVIAPSQAIAEELAAAGYERERIHLIPNGVAIGPLPPRGRETKHAARTAVSDANMSLEMVLDQPLVVYIGRLHPQKGLDDLARAWEEFAARRPNARLWFVGEGPHRDDLYDLLVDLGLHHQAFLPGAFDDVSEVLAAADLLVLPSYEEGMSLALLEAMAAGVPVVATDIPGNRTLITHGEHGLLVPPHQPDALRGAIERMLDEPGLANRLAHNAYERVLRDFSLTQMAARHLEVIEAARK